jgi:hypothetical protein
VCHGSQRCHREWQAEWSRVSREGLTRSQADVRCRGGQGSQFGLVGSPVSLRQAASGSGVGIIACESHPLTNSPSRIPTSTVGRPLPLQRGSGLAEERRGLCVLPVMSSSGKTVPLLLGRRETWAAPRKSRGGGTSPERAASRSTGQRGAGGPRGGVLAAPPAVSAGLVPRLPGADRCSHLPTATAAGLCWDGLGGWPCDAPPRRCCTSVGGGGIV